MAYLSSFYELAWDPPLVANTIRVECPPPTVWTPGSMTALHYGITQEGMAPRNYGWTVNSQRAWPGFPLTGFQQLNDGATFDLAGRRVAARDVSGAGVHTVELAPAGTLRSGVYFLRLAQGAARATARAVLLSGRD